MDWTEIKDKYNVQCAADTIRKSSSTIFGGEFREAFLKNQLYTNSDESSKETEIDKKIRELRKERNKWQTINIEQTRINRQNDRQEMFYEYVGKICETLPVPDFEPLSKDEDFSTEYILTLADMHYGAKFKSENNEYSPEIAKNRLEFLAGEVECFVKKHKVGKLHVVSLGDTIQGILRVSDLKLNDSSIVKATVEISRLIALFLRSISTYVEVDYYHVPTANHTQLRPLGTKASELADEDLEYVIGNYIKDLCIKNDRINIHLADEGKQYIEIPLHDYEIIAMHGHTIKNMESSIKDLSMLRRSFLDYLILGHYHSGKELPSFEGCCSDTEILVSPSFAGSDPYSDSIMKGNKAAVKIYGFNFIYGHNETYKIILN